MTVIINRNTLFITIFSSTNVVLEPLLLNEKGKFSKAVVTVKAGSYIGGTNGSVALSTGTLRDNTTGLLLFPNGVTINNYGSIHAHGGTANGGTGGTAVMSQIPNLVFNNYGAVRGGGGGGGKGGDGGWGNWVLSWSLEKYSTTAPDYFFQTKTCQSDGNNACKWDGTQLGYACSQSYLQNNNLSNKTYIYRRGSIQGISDWWYIQRGEKKLGVAGVGTNGGVGRGYNQSIGASGEKRNGTYRAGYGNAGGAGGDWGATGKVGLTGGVGGYFNTTVDAAFGGLRGGRISTAGTAGSAGGSAGYYIWESIDGSGTTFNNYGTIAGRISITPPFNGNPP